MLDPERVHPRWTLALPLLSLLAMMASPPERRMPVAPFVAALYAAMQWMLPRCRFRRDHYLGPINIALVLFFLELIVVPSLIMLVGPENRILPHVPAYSTMQGVILLQAAAYAALCVGMSHGPRPGQRAAFPPVLLQGPGPTPLLIAVFFVLGVAGFAAAFGSPGRLVEYFTSNEEFDSGGEGLTGLVGTFFRPFFAISLVAAWGRIAARGRWGVSLAAGLLAAVFVTLANLTYGFNRAAFVFPLVSMLAVFSAKVKRVPFAFTALAVALSLPLLLSLEALRSSRMVGGKQPEPFAFQRFLKDTSENVQAYAGAPQFIGIFCERIGWGEQLYAGSSLLGSLMTPVPVLGKGFRESGGPTVYNYAIYQVRGIEDQILPFAVELFANFHLPGTVAGFLLLGLVLARLQEWFATSQSLFVAFLLQYLGMWTAMLSAWSLAIFAQICIYFFGPLYLYAFVRALPGLLRWMTNSRPATVLEGAR